MSFWTNKEQRTALDDAENLAYAPSGGPLKMWLLGIGLALIPLGYGGHCLVTGHALFFGRDSTLELDGPAATALAIAYLSLGTFLHAHWFWGLQPRFATFSYLLKFASVLAFLGSLGFVMYKLMA